MLFAPQSTQKTIYEILSTDAALQTLIGGTVGDPKIYDFVPDNKVFPFITIGEGPWTDRGNHTTEGLQTDFVVNVWYRAPGRGRLKVQEIQKRIDELMHKSDPCIEDFNVIVLRRKLIDILIDPDNVTLHGVQTFKLMIGES